MLSYLLAALESEEDKRRFTELYEENHVRAEQTALRILRDPHDAEDAVQNAFLQVIHHFDEISEIPCKKLGFWIMIDVGYEVAVASDGVIGIAMFDDTIDLVLLDIMDRPFSLGCSLFSQLRRPLSTE